MAEITAKMVMQLRERTGAAMMLCKKALTESGGDTDKAIAYIRTHSTEKAQDRGERVAGEGVIAVVVLDNQDAAIIELNSETDFVARSEDFKSLANELAVQVAKGKGHSVETVLTQESHAQPGVTVGERINTVFTKLRENIVFKRVEFISTGPNGALAGYVHVPSNDKLGVLVELEAASPEAAKSEAVQAIGREVAMQIAASNPRFLNREEVPAAVLESEQNIVREIALKEGKPEAALPKIIEGRIRKFYEENALVDQAWLREPKKSVAQVLKENNVSVKRYVRFAVGENITGVSTSGSIKETAE
jgi:elongation factor Ts